MNKWLLTFITLMTLLSGFCAPATTFYVDPNGDNSDGSTLAKAYTTLAAAKAPTHDGDIVYVGTGTYARWGFWYTNNVKWITLGGPASVTVTNLADGNFILAAEAGTYAGFTFDNATGAWGTVGIRNGTVLFTNCIFKNNRSITPTLESYTTSATGNVWNCNFLDNVLTGSGAGGGVYVHSTCAFNLFNCSFSNNYAPNSGGAGYVAAGGSLMLNNVQCYSNRCGNDSSGFYANTGSTLIGSNVTFIGGSAGRYNVVTKGVWYNCLFYGNTDNSGTSVSLQSSLYNCTVIGNYSRTADGTPDAGYAAIYNSLTWNCIVWMNYPKDIDGGTHYNLCYGQKGTYAGAPTLYNSITNYPNFIDDFTATATNSNTGSNFVLGVNGVAGLRLLSNSVCVDTGTNQSWQIGATDLAGVGRIYNSIVDMGAYEYIPFRYLSPFGSATPPYDTWAAAANTPLQVFTGSRDGQIIVVTNGTYPRFGNASCHTNLAWTSVNGPGVTIISASGSHYAVYMDGGSMSGFTVCNVSNSSAGIICNGNMTLSNMVIRNNNGVSDGPGGGIKIIAGTVKVYNSHIYDNGIPTGGGGIGLTGGTAYFWDCGVSNNVATGAFGGAAYVDTGCKLYAERCIFSSNSANRASAIHSIDALSSWFTNCIIVRNFILAGGDQNTVRNSTLVNCLLYGNVAVYQSGGNLCRFENCTIVGNYASSANESPNWGCTGANNIFWNNYPYDLQGSDGPYSNTCYQSKNGSPGIGDGVITNYPKFGVDLSAAAATNTSGYYFSLPGGDASLALQGDSPCVDTGTNLVWMSGAIDLLGNLRIYNSIVDMGTYEYTADIKDSGYRSAELWWSIIQ